MKANDQSTIQAIIQHGLPSSVPLPLPTKKDVCRIAIDRVHFSAKRPIQLQLTVHGKSGWTQPLIAEWIGDSADKYCQSELASLLKSRRAQLSKNDLNNLISLPEWGLVIRRPGLDSKLPGLRLLHNPEEAAEFLTPYSKSSPEKFTVELVAHRLGKRAVLRIKTSTNDVFYIRLRGVNSQSGGVCFSRHQALHEQLKELAPVALPKPLGYSAPLGAAVFAELEGAPTDFAGASALAKCRMISQALSTLHVLEDDSLPIHTGENEYHILSQHYELTRQYFPELAEQFSTSMKWISNHLNSLRDTNLLLTHRDLHQKQLLMTNKTVGILDFDTICHSHPALDLGNLQAHIFFEGRQKGFNTEVLEKALASELSTISDFDKSLWRSSALLRLAMIYAFTDEKHNTIQALLREASSCQST